MENQLSSYLPASVTVRDPSVEVLALLRVLYALNRHYGSLYPPAASPQPLLLSDFINMKLTAKANRQLQDPLVIMTGNLPQWLPQIAYAWFVYIFLLLIIIVCFDDQSYNKILKSLILR